MSNLEVIEGTATSPNLEVMPPETNQVQQVAPVQILSMISNLVQRDNFDINALEKLMVMQNQAEDRQSQKAFNADFSKMMKKIPVILKTGVNEFNGTAFDKLEDIVEITRPILAEFGFSVTYRQQQEMYQGVKAEVGNIFGMMTVTCVLKHNLSHEEENSVMLPISIIKGQTPAQAVGMILTYGRRQTLKQALNIATSGADKQGNVSDFAKVAGSEKKPITEQRFNKAIALIKSGEADLFTDLIDRFELTPEQKTAIKNMNEKEE